LLPKVDKTTRDRRRRPPRRTLSGAGHVPPAPSHAPRKLGLRDAWQTLTARAPLSGYERREGGLWPTRYESLDLWRALIAIGIVLHHIAHISAGINTGRVLLFFVISGYCISAVAESSLRRNITPWQFLGRRLWRIYPSYLLAIGFFVLTRWYKSAHHGVDELAHRFDGAARTAGEWFQNLTLTQWLYTMDHPVSRPGSNPALFVSAHWSLAYEQQFYLVIAALIAIAAMWPKLRLRWTIPALVPFAFLIGLAWPQTIHGIFIEFWTAFAVGALVYYRLSAVYSRQWKIVIDVLLAALITWSIIGMVTDPRLDMVDTDRSKWHEWLIAGVFGALLIVLRPLDGLFSRSWLTHPLKVLGRLSFSLFLIHQFNIGSIATASAALIRLVNPGYLVAATYRERPLYDHLLQLVLHIALAAIFWLFCEYPFLARRERTAEPEKTSEPDKSAARAAAV
jgi:peptidoglycan/LPS O-acetylase OafA/YrhL